MAKYRKKPVEIEAVQWTGNNINVVDAFVGTGKEYKYENECLYIKTLEGKLKANIGDYIIKGVNGEFYPCKPDIFEKTYEKVE